MATFYTVYDINLIQFTLLTLTASLIIQFKLCLRLNKLFGGKTEIYVPHTCITTLGLVPQLLR